MKEIEINQFILTFSRVNIIWILGVQDFIHLCIFSAYQGMTNKYAVGSLQYIIIKTVPILICIRDGVKI